MESHPYSCSGAAFGPVPVNVHVDKHFGKYEIAKCQVPSWLRKLKVGDVLETPNQDKSLFIQLSRAKEDQFCFFLYGCDWPAGEFHNPQLNSFVGIEWNGVSPEASVCFTLDENGRLLDSEFDHDGGEMMALGWTLGHLQIHGEGKEVATLNEAQKGKARQFLASQFLAKMESGQAEAFGKAINGKRKRIIEMRDSLANWNGQDYWTNNEDEIINGIGEAMKVIATGKAPDALTRESILEHINTRRSTKKKPRNQFDPVSYTAVDHSWLSRKIALLGLAWIRHGNQARQRLRRHGAAPVQH